MNRFPLLSVACVSLVGAAHFALAQPDDRIAWRYELPSSLPGAFVGISDDGTVYATDREHLYSLTRAGDLNWSLAGPGGGRPITFGPDGAIYTSTHTIGVDGVAAVNPNGTLRWQYAPPTTGVLHAGPNIGPDGRVYAVQEIRAGNGLGAFCLDAGGNLRWSNRGAPEIREADLSNSDIVFGNARFFAGMDFLRGSGAVTYAFSFTGNQVGYSGSGGWEIPATSFPRLMNDGRLIFRYGQTGLMAVRQDGTVDWQLLHPSGASIVADPAVGPDGVIYSGDWAGIDLWAVHPNGSTRWVRGYESGYQLDTLSVAPDNSVLIGTGTRQLDGVLNGWVRGYHPATGDLLWELELAPEQGLAQIVTTFCSAAFSTDSRTAYLTTRFVGSGVGHSYVYALHTGERSSYALAVANLVGGSDATFTLTGATPNRQQYIVYSLRGPGSTFVPQLNVTLDLRRPALLISGRADGQGTLQRVVHVPGSATGRTVWFQGAEINQVTPVVSQVVQ